MLHQRLDEHGIKEVLHQRLMLGCEWTSGMFNKRSLCSGSGGHSAHVTSYSDSGYQDSSVSHYSNQNVVRTEPRSSLSRSPRAEGQTSGQVSLMAALFKPS